MHISIHTEQKLHDIQNSLTALLSSRMLVSMTNPCIPRYTAKSRRLPIRKKYYIRVLGEYTTVSSHINENKACACLSTHLGFWAQIHCRLLDITKIAYPEDPGLAIAGRAGISSVVTSRRRTRAWRGANTITAGASSLHFRGLSIADC
ncbi:hypothetical protein EVAR_79651_1 [Eumeta japonica]|uniref:Uncharacterized protein n=1 Tax=Eumeta variegata TaxID=151549 RepID=A0A4C1WBE5_EUMVA|nr:hypothetical protein EVAR_79651_1 [Eumeta japonica]